MPAKNSIRLAVKTMTIYIILYRYRSRFFPGKIASDKKAVIPKTFQLGTADLNGRELPII